MRDKHILVTTNHEKSAEVIVGCLPTEGLNNNEHWKEREVVKMKKAEYMESHIGEVFEGVISGVTDWGFYVELPNTVEGLVHVNSLTDDYYIYDPSRYTLTGEKNKRSFSMGQKVTVRVSEADPRERSVDFVLAE